MVSLGNFGSALIGTRGKRLTSECFFLVDRSRVMSYRVSTKFLRQGTFTSFFTAWKQTVFLRNGKAAGSDVSVNLTLFGSDRQSANHDSPLPRELKFPRRDQLRSA